MSPARPFAVGDLVALKSGGPAMIVAGYDEDGDVECIHWNEGLHQITRDAIGPAFLTPFGSAARDFEDADQARAAIRAALSATDLRGPFRADHGAVRDAAGAHLCDAMPDRPEGDARAAACARAIAAALNAANQEPGR